MSPSAPSTTSIRWSIAGYLALAGFFALEGATRERGSASDLDATADDRGTTEGIVRAYAMAGLTAPFMRLLPSPRLPLVLAPAGLGLEVAGLGLRAWSMRTLGRAYSRTLRTEAEQEVIETGAYRLVRHPGYLASLMIWSGFALTSRRVPTAVVVTAVIGDAYRRRIAAEEHCSCATFRGTRPTAPERSG